jgi:hypothetical protein
MEQQQGCTMDNPHIRDIDLAYLAGIIDGEGTVTLERNGTRRKGNGQMGFSPKVIIANTNRALIQRITNIESALGVNPHIKVQLAGKYKRGKVMYWATIAGLSKCGRILRPILPYLVAKDGQARIVLDFIDYRGDPIIAKGKPYGEYELGLVEKIRALNIRGMSETEDHGLWRPIMAARQMTVQSNGKPLEEH